MLPPPCLSFTLPSIHDRVKLDCRVYRPPCLRNTPHSGTSWVGHTAVVAHPYAPLGGCSDDPVVHLTAGTLLELGFLVATFNFRGAASSEGATSWTSRPEQADYTSVVGFLAYYAHYLRTSAPAHPADQHHVPIMLLAGYSYGAMITIRLPPLDVILSHFTSPIIHTAEADIRLRARYLAEAQSERINSPTSPRSPLGVRVGGDEGYPWRAHDSRPTPGYQREERIRENVRRLCSRAELVYKNSSRRPNEGQGGNGMDPCLENIAAQIAFQSAYVAISPPFGFVTGLATMSFSNPFSSWRRRSGHHAHDGADMDHAPHLATNPTLVIYGGQDGFVTYKKIREWAQRLAMIDASQFRYVEVAGAGHFWAENNAIYHLRDAIGTFAAELTRVA